MKPIVFHYQRELRLAKTGLKHSPRARARPFASGKLVGGKTEFPFRQALLDTGAELTIFPMAAMQLAGVTKTLGHWPIILRGQPVQLALANVIVELENDESFSLRWKTTVGFPPQTVQLNYPVLGQAGCFEFLHAAFYDDEKVFTLDPAPNFPGVVSFPSAMILK